MIAPVVGESDDSVAGVIKNEGDMHYETLYMRLSKVQYRRDPPWYCLWCSPCYYRVPVSMYFISE